MKNYFKVLQYLPLLTTIVAFIEGIKNGAPTGFSEPLSIKGVPGDLAWTPRTK